MCENMRRVVISGFSAPSLGLHPKQVQDLDEMIKSLKKKNDALATPETQLISLCQSLAYAYQALLRTLNYSYIGHPNNQEGMEKTTHLVRVEEASPESKREHQ